MLLAATYSAGEASELVGVNGPRVRRYNDPLDFRTGKRMRLQTVLHEALGGFGCFAVVEGGQVDAFVG
jgi:hypothetical protein